MSARVSASVNVSVSSSTSINTSISLHAVTILCINIRVSVHMLVYG